MKILFIGGTGLISSACSDLVLERGHELFLLNRSASAKYPAPEGATVLRGDIHADEAQLSALVAGHRFDAVVDFIAYTVDDIERALRQFNDKAGQFVFISSASAYQKPPRHYLITEETPLENPFWEYARDKIACEDRLIKAYRDIGFPFTIVRPSLTYGPSQIPLCMNSWVHPWTAIDRIKKGKPVIVPGDGTSLWMLTWNADFAKGLVGLLGNPRAIGQSFHITSNEVLTWNQIYLEVFSALHLEPKITHVSSDLIAAYWPHAVGSLIGDKANSVVFDNAKIKRLVPDFDCKVAWVEGVRRTLAWHDSHPEFQTVDREMDGMWDKVLAGYERASPGR